MALHAAIEEVAAEGDFFTMRTLGFSLLALAAALVVTTSSAISQPSALPYDQTGTAAVEHIGFRDGYVGFRYRDGVRRCFYRPHYRVYYAPYWVRNRPYYYWPYYFSTRPPHAWSWC